MFLVQVHPKCMLIRLQPGPKFSGPQLICFGFSSGVWYGMGGTLMLLASVLEFIIGNTFTFVAFGTYGKILPRLSAPRDLIIGSRPLTDQTGGWWIAQAITITPFYKATATYEPNNPIDPGFHASFGTLSIINPFLEPIERILLTILIQDSLFSIWQYQHLSS